ncbi:MAG: TIGR02444 family protein [Pseudomonadota bacterium]
MGEQSLWDFASQLYTQPGVEEACLYLQDNCRLNVSLLLFLMWSTKRYGQMQPAFIRECCDLSDTWDGAVVKPFRQVRRWLKHQGAQLGDQDTDDLRSQTKGLELHSEKLLLQALEQKAMAMGLESQDINDVDSIHMNLRVMLVHLKLAVDQSGAKALVGVGQEAFPSLDGEAWTVFQNELVKMGGA